MAEDKQQVKPFFRVFNTDVIGEKPIVMALLKVKGIGFSLSNIICNSLGILKTKKAGLLSADDAKRMENLIKEKKDLPSWLLNRVKEEVTGETKHLVGADLKFAVETDIKRARRLKTYKGIRHSAGLPVRGQRTRGHFRKIGKAIGVQKSKVTKKGK